MCARTRELAVHVHVPGHTSGGQKIICGGSFCSTLSQGKKKKVKDGGRESAGKRGERGQRVLHLHENVLGKTKTMHKEGTL